MQKFPSRDGAGGSVPARTGPIRIFMNILLPPGRQRTQGSGTPERGLDFPTHPHRGCASEVAINVRGAFGASLGGGIPTGIPRDIPGSNRFRGLSQLGTTLGVLPSGLMRGTRTLR